MTNRCVVLVGGSVETEDNNPGLNSCRVGRHGGRAQTLKGMLRRPEVIIRGISGMISWEGLIADDCRPSLNDNAISQR